MNFKKSFANYYHQVSKNGQNIGQGKRKTYKTEEKTYEVSLNLKLPQIVKIEENYNNIIQNRRSTRSFNSELISLEQVSTLLYYANGTLNDLNKRPYPSGGALYPLELYVIGMSFSTNQLSNKVFHYHSKSHSLENFKQLNEQEITSLFIPDSQKTVAKAQLILVISCCFDRSYQKYSERSYRYSLLEAGHMSQNICLTSSALDLGCCPIGGYIDDKINAELELDINDEATLLMFAIGGK